MWLQRLMTPKHAAFPASNLLRLISFRSGVHNSNLIFSSHRADRSGMYSTIVQHNTDHPDHSDTCEEVHLKLQAQGFAIYPKRILSREVCDAVKEKMPNLFAGIFETGIYPDEWHWRNNMSKPSVTREMCNTWKSDRTIASIVLSEDLGKLVATIMGWDSVRIGQDDLIWKPPNQISTVVGFHQDSAYISENFVPYENNSVTVWFALDDANNENGCVEYAVGSHLWRPVPHRDMDLEAANLHSSEVSSGTTQFHTGEFHACDSTNYREGIPQKHREGITLKNAHVFEGHAIFHHQDVWHGSGPNLSRTRQRRALVAHYLRGDIKFKADNKENLDTNSPTTPWGRTKYIYGRYKRFRSYALDESFFPIVYASPGTNKERTRWLDEYIK